VLTLKEWIYFVLIAFIYIGWSSADAGSAKPNDAASSQGIVTELECKQLKTDIMVIGQALGQGMPIENLKAMLKSADEIGEETHARMIAMIESAYTYQGPLIDWMHEKYKACMGV
jgi:hypothetical protein